MSLTKERLLSNEFIGNSLNHSDADKVVTMCQKYNIDVQKISDYIKTFMETEEIGVLTIGDFGRFENFLQNEEKKLSSKENIVNISGKKRPAGGDTPLGNQTHAKKATVTPAASTSGSGHEGGDFNNNGIVAITPSDAGKAVLNNTYGSNSTKSTKVVAGTDTIYKKRNNSNQATRDFQLDLGVRGDFDKSSREPLGKRCDVKQNDADFNNIQDRYRYMFTTLEERARALETHMLNMQAYMCTKVLIKEEDLTPMGIPSQDDVWVCGRVCCDAAEGRINKSSVLLEGTRRDSGGRRVKLDLRYIESLSLFPGQIVLVFGTNSSGREMVAKQIYEGSPLPTPQSSPKQLLEYQYDQKYQNGKALNIMAAAGPFTTTDTLNYEPLYDLIQVVAQRKPDVVILTGPFVDVTQPLLAAGDAVLQDVDDRTGVVKSEHVANYEMVFRERIIRDSIELLLNSEEFEDIATQFILVPNLNDGHHEDVYPQPPFGDRKAVKTQLFEETFGVLNIPFTKDTDIRKRIHLVSNPCMFRVNEVLFGVTSNDVLLQLNMDSITEKVTNKLDRLSAHVLQQQSFAPQFPAPASMPDNLDMRHYNRHVVMPTYSPDVLILPSKLSTSVSDVLGSLVVNPGQLSKGKNGGTYLEMHIHPHKEEVLRTAMMEEKELLSHDVAKRTCVKKINI
jgi:DNA polymerase alpha subunit B